MTAVIRVALNVTLAAVAVCQTTLVLASAASQDGSADELATAMLARIKATPTECPAAERLVRFCGKLPNTMQPAFEETKRNIDDFLTSRGAEPVSASWTGKKKVQERLFRFVETTLTVEIHTRSRVVTLGYPVPGIITRRSRYPALWDTIRQALVEAQVDNEIRFIQFYHHDDPPLAAAILYDQDELMVAVLSHENQAWRVVEVLPPQPWGGTKGIDERCSPGQLAVYPGYCVTPPILVKRTVPDYPGVARIKRLGARVVVEFMVQKDGSVRDVAVVESTTPGFGFEKAAMRAVREWKYTPALMGGYPTELRIRATVDFEGRPSQAGP